MSGSDQLAALRHNFNDRSWAWCRGRTGRYAVSDRGDIVSFVRGKAVILKSTIDSLGYPSFTPEAIGGVRRSVRIHQEVAAAFIEGYSSELMVNHKDGVKNNNHYTNLEWVTAGENIRHAFATGLIPIHQTTNPPHGEASPKAKLTESEVRRIYNCRRVVYAKDLASTYSVHINTIYDIWSGRKWKHLRLKEEANGGTARSCEVAGGCPNAIQQWHNGRGLCTPHWYSARQYLHQPEVS